MKPLPDAGSATSASSPVVRRVTGPQSNLAPEKRWARQRWLLAGLGLLGLHLGHMLSWQQSSPHLWFPPAGIGLALIAWMGKRGLGLVALDAFLALVHRSLVGSSPAGLLFASEVWGTLLQPLEVLVAWWLFHHLARGSRRLDDPRSAILFLFLVPGLTAGLFAFLRALPCWLLGPESMSLFLWVDLHWISHALGMVTLAPLLLVVLTPWLIRCGVIAEEICRDPQQRGLPPPGRLLRGDAFELAGLALGAGILGFLLACGGKGEAAGEWQLWGVSFLLIVWATVRHGLRGGIVVAGTGAVVPLTVLALQGVGEWSEVVLELNLLAQCSATLLVTASANWIRQSEARYRRVVGHMPLVLYSARVLQPASRGQALAAEITFASPACLDILGCAPEKLLGTYEHWLTRAHPSDREIVLAALAQLGRQKDPVTCEYRLSPTAAAQVYAGKHAGQKTASLPFSSSRIIQLQAAPEQECWIRDTLVPVFGADGALEGWDGVVVDITEQRALSNDLRQTTSMFYALVANLPAGVFFVQAPSGRPILVNARARQLLGQREDSSAGLDHLARTYRLHRPDGTLYPTEELPVTLALHRGLTTMRDDIVIHRPDGQRLPLVTWAAPIDLRGQGQTQAAVWVFEDLTALHQAEAARRESEARLRAVVETMAEGLVVQDQSGTIVDCNPAACVILGLSRDRLCGHSLLSPEWQYQRADGSPFPSAEHPTRLCMETGKPVRDLVLGIVLPSPPNGHLSPGAVLPQSSVRWVLVNAMPLPLRGGQGGSVVTTFSDITAHRQAQEVLRASEEKYRGLVETLPIMVVQFDKEGQITYVNPATETTTGHDAREFQGTSWQSLILPDDLPHVQAVIPEVLGGQTMRAEFRYRAKDGRELVGYVLAQPRHQEGRVIGITALVVDMTRERRLEAELQRSQRLELIGRLSSGVAHDFNNLLNVILTLTDLARANLSEGHPVRADLQRISEAGHQAASLASQLLAFSKQRRTASRRVDVNRVASRTLEMLRATLPAGIALDCSLTDDRLHVQADEMQLHQVLMNLCLNARDAMPQGGQLRITTLATPAANGHGTESGSGWVRLSVEDTGQGMSETVKARIFEPFFSTKEHGTGLGLAVVQQIVQGHSGVVEVWSEPGEGARFDIWLPREASEPRFETELAQGCLCK